MAAGCPLLRGVRQFEIGQQPLKLRVKIFDRPMELGADEEFIALMSALEIAFPLRRPDRLAERFLANMRPALR